jgi:hypothetical protein
MFKIGDKVVFGDFRSNYSLYGFTIRKSYVVINYDDNKLGWPDGCSGLPFVTVVNDKGQTVTLLADRFIKGKTNV